MHFQGFYNYLFTQFSQDTIYLDTTYKQPCLDSIAKLRLNILNQYFEQKLIIDDETKTASVRENAYNKILNVINNYCYKQMIETYEKSINQ